MCATEPVGEHSQGQQEGKDGTFEHNPLTAGSGRGNSCVPLAGCKEEMAEQSLGTGEIETSAQDGVTMSFKYEMYEKLRVGSSAPYTSNY